MMMSKKYSLFSFVLLGLMTGVSIQLFGDETPAHNHEALTQTIAPSTDAMDMEPHDHAAMDHAMDNKTELSGTVFSTDITDLPEAVPPETVYLKDGDSITITAEYIKKRIGNRTLRMLAYNRSIPGPFIKVDQNSEILINFKNETDIDQTIHSHGVRVDNLYDGVPEVTQNAVTPGESFVYRLKFKDAGVFWYHPHTRDDYGQEMGLYGNYLITPSDVNYWNPVNREIPLVIDDILINNDKVEDFYKEFTNYALLGRFGNEFLVNGEKDFSLIVNKGEVIRFFVTNVSNTRTYNISIPGVQLKMVGGDLGKFEHEMYASNFQISPAERVVIETIFKDSGSYTLTHIQPDKRIALATFNTNEENSDTPNHADSFYALRHNNDVENEFNSFRRYINSAPDKNLKLTIELTGQDIDHNEHVHMDMEINSDSHNDTQHEMPSMDLTPDHQPLTPTEEILETVQWDDPEQSDRTNMTPDIYWKLVDEETGKASLDINDWTFKQNDLVKIRIVNDENADHIMQHPIHVHGQQFVILSVDGLPNNNLVWKDTALIYPGQTTDILVEMSNTGVWMLHCHISEHLHAGMVMKFRVEDNNGLANGDSFRSVTGNSSHQH